MQRNIRSKKNKLQERLKKIQGINSLVSGKGEYIYKNNTKGTLILSKESLDGKKNIPIGGTWRGDDHYMYLFKSNDALLIETISDSNNQKESNMENKLILDQPETFTTKGAVEQVEIGKDSVAKLNEVVPNENLEDEKEKLINEDPMDGIQIILND